MHRIRITKDIKKGIINLIKEYKCNGISEKKVCKLLDVSSRRVRNWKKRIDLEDRRPGPVNAPHALLEDEKEIIRELAKNEDFTDDSHRILAVKAMDMGLVSASPSSFYRQMRHEGLTTARRVVKKGNTQKPVREELKSPNKRWCWDISYLKTLVTGIFLYLYVVLDEYSRKVVAWKVSWRMTHQEGMELIDDAILNENLSEEQIQMLNLYNDRGVQMKAKNFQKMLKDLGIHQVFSRPRTPNDNPFVESSFSIVKGDPEYPGYFVDVEAAKCYFENYLREYNTERLHGGIGYVTPEQKHNGLAEKIFEERRKKIKKARTERITANRVKFMKNCLTRNEKSVKLPA
jgi:putative transposase